MSRFYFSSVKPLIEKYEKTIAYKIDSTYFRFFYFTENLLNVLPGKTLHNTMNSIYIHHHWDLDNNNKAAEYKRVLSIVVMYPILEMVLIFLNLIIRIFQ